MIGLQVCYRADDKDWITLEPVDDTTTIRKSRDNRKVSCEKSDTNQSDLPHAVTIEVLQQDPVTIPEETLNKVPKDSVPPRVPTKEETRTMSQCIRTWIEARDKHQKVDAPMLTWIATPMRPVTNDTVERRYLGSVNSHEPVRRVAAINNIQATTHVRRNTVEQGTATRANALTEYKPKDLANSWLTTISSEHQHEFKGYADRTLPPTSDRSMPHIP